MTVSKRTLVAAMAGSALMLAASVSCLVAAGPLNPPAGAVTNTYKTLTEVEPRLAINTTNTPGDADSLFKISLPGSYYLTGNITGVNGKHGIEIAASGVTIDLNGFDLQGNAAMGAFDGICTTVSNLSNITIRNGSLRNWGSDAVDVSSFPVFNSRIEGVLASGNVSHGIRAGNGSTLLNCAAYLNTGGGISAGIGSSLSDCSARGNVGFGFDLTGGNALTNCSASENDGIGIDTGNGCTLSGCSCYSNNSDGISAGTNCAILNCSVYLNSGNGIRASSGCTVADCTSRLNTSDGIFCTSACLIKGNLSTNNGNSGDGAGIHAAGTDVRIEGNSCDGSDRGIDVDLAGNLIIRNSCSANATNWVIVANNIVGPILDRTSPGSAAINGNSAPDSTGSTHPNANFTY